MEIDTNVDIVPQGTISEPPSAIPDTISLEKPPTLQQVPQEQEPKPASPPPITAPPTNAVDVTADVVVENPPETSQPTPGDGEPSAPSMIQSPPPPRVDSAVSPADSQPPVPPPNQLQPPPAGSAGAGARDSNRHLNVHDALGYLDAVKNKFQNNPDVYNDFLEIMKDFKSQRIDTPGVIQRVSTLFKGHPALIQGFNTFLPPGYRIECSTDPQDVNIILVTTPHGTMTQSTTGLLHVSSGPSNAGGLGPQDSNLASGSQGDFGNAPGPIQGASSSGFLSGFGTREHNTHFEPTEQAIEYVNRIKQRYADDPASYHHFLKLLEKFNKNPGEQHQVLQQIIQLFRNAPDLLDEFKLFLPADRSAYADLLGMFGHIAADNEKESSKAGASAKRKDKADSSTEKSNPSPQKRKRKPVEKDVPSTKAVGPSKAKKPKTHHPAPEPSPPPPSQHPSPQVFQRAPSPVFAPPFQHVHVHAGSSHMVHPVPPPVIEPQMLDDNTFFERVRDFLNNRETYDEFLKLVNLFTQDVIDLRALVYQASSFLGESELMAQLKEIVGWEEKERRDMENEAANAPKPLLKPSKADLTIRYGPSYRKLPPNYQLAYDIEDIGVLQDGVKLVLSFLDRTHGQIGAPDRRKIEGFLRKFIPLFFMFYPREFDTAFEVNGDEESEMMSDGLGSVLGDDESGSVAGSTRSKNGKKSGIADIRKKLLRTQQEKTSRKTRSIASAPGSRASSPPMSNGNGMDIDPPRSTAPMTNGVRRIATNTVKGYKPPSASSRKNNSRRGTFYANTPIYVFLRLLNLLYSRLLLCKRLGEELAGAAKQSANGVPEGASHMMLDGVPAPEHIGNAAEHFYSHLLECCEKLFDNVIDQATFEDTARYMFGMKAYNVFTLDKVIGALIKQVQIILADSKNKELVQLLQRERENPSFSTQDQVNYRRKAESVIGMDEHLYKINYIRESCTFTVELLGKEDPRSDDSPAMIERWSQYMDSYQKDIPDDAVTSKGKVPFLKRNLRLKASLPPTFISHSGLEIQICMRTYRLFYVMGSEDSFNYRYPPDDLQKLQQCVSAQVGKRRSWLDKVDKDGWTSSPRSSKTVA
ncbi:hypothetical protein M422DRAFT_54338 [Sphaerobolus stellatus SS14]|uniref:Sin3 C-terminal domain-containing protein n=1 Tax=Sphaerobolus stellatus (strain SS14) TaxID=990650 RepID=A0A0C9U4D8_SPHS4|nr:hypothetical protein M422DRAFT_54338 [Sphaerobolus stellatus SS14]